MPASSLPRGLYAITDPALTPDEQLLPACEAALAGGAVMLQYRDKHAGEAERISRARSLRSLCDQYGASLLINDEPGLARAVAAQGVHLGQQDTHPDQARSVLGPDAIVGVSCHGEPELAHAAARRGMDYVALGRFFASHTKPGAPPATVDTLRELRSELHVPIVAIGGVNPDNAGELIRAGADLVAVIHDLFSAPDIEARARQFRACFEETP
jgi:thiamine-phosphate pyrophosphorylase